MKPTQIFPAILIFFNLCAATMCGYSGDYRRMFYWLAAAVLNVTVTF